MDERQCKSPSTSSQHYIHSCTAFLGLKNLHQHLMISKWQWCATPTEAFRQHFPTPPHHFASQRKVCSKCPNIDCQPCVFCWRTIYVNNFCLQQDPRLSFLLSFPAYILAYFELITYKFIKCIHIVKKLVECFTYHQQVLKFILQTINFYPH